MKHDFIPKPDCTQPDGSCFRVGACLDACTRRAGGDEKRVAFLETRVRALEGLITQATRNIEALQRWQANAQKLERKD